MGFFSRLAAKAAGVVAGVTRLAVTTPTVDVDSMVQSSVDGLTTYLNIDNLKIILLAGVGVTVGFFIFWFAWRFIKRKISGAMKKGTM